MSRKVHLKIIMVMILLVVLCVLTACDWVKTYDSKTEAKFELLMPNGWQTVNVFGTKKVTEKDINAVVYQERSTRIEYKIKGDLDVQNIDTKENLEKYYLCKNPYGDFLGTEYVDYVRIEYSYANFDAKIGPFSSAEQDGRYYERFEKWANFVKNKTLYLRQVNYIGEIMVYNAMDIENATVSIKNYEICNWIDVEEFLTPQIKELFQDIKETLESDLEKKDKLKEELDILLKNTDYASYTDIILLLFEAILNDPSDVKILPISRYVTTELPIVLIPKYSFKGFYDEENGQGVKYVNNKGEWVLNPIGNFSLYAHYEVKPIQVSFENEWGDEIMLGEVADNQMPKLPQMENILGWYITGTNIKIADADGVYRPGYELITNDEYQSAISEEDDTCILSLEYRNDVQQ